jgi:hypothetical protein
MVSLLVDARAAHCLARLWQGIFPKSLVVFFSVQHISKADAVNLFRLGLGSRNKF